MLLRAIDYAEADRIVTLYTRRLGKIALLARGARRSRKRFQGALEPFSLLRVEFSTGREELGRLTHAQIFKPFPGILRDLKAIHAAGAALDLVRSATPVCEPDEKLFDATLTALEIFDKAPDWAWETLLCFQTHAMKLIGFAPRFDECGQCRKRPRDTQPGRFDPVTGCLICNSCGQAPIQLSAAVRRRLHEALSPRWTQAIGNWTAAQLEEGRSAISSFIAYRLETRDRATTGQMRSLFNGRK